ncbi:MAG: hypothetical protein F6K26_05885 [Moorea sp. SIO2I5]|nr:hypothetical protein [Moorena sp. SIO2I5]
MILPEHQRRTTCNLNPATLILQPWPKGHATRTTSNLGQKATLREQPSTLAKRPRYANNLQPPTSNLKPPTLNLQPATCNLQP